MNATQKEKIKSTLVGNLSKGNDAPRSLPTAKGDTFIFKLSDKLVAKQTTVIRNETVEWDGIVAEDGSVLSATQITRRRNGLPLTGNTVKERISSFIDLFDENDTLKLTVADVRTRDFTNVDDDGKTSVSKSSYLIFKVG